MSQPKPVFSFLVECRPAASGRFGRCRTALEETEGLAADLRAENRGAQANLDRLTAETVKLRRVLA